MYVGIFTETARKDSFIKNVQQGATVLAALVFLVVECNVT